MNKQQIKQTKQIVYLPVKVQNASGNYIPDKSVLIVKEQYELDKYWEDLVEKQEGYFFTPSQFNNYISGIIKQSLNTAAEKASLSMFKKSQYSEKSKWKKVSKKEAEKGVDIFFYQCETRVDKQSILNTFEEIYEGLKV